MLLHQLPQCWGVPGHGLRGSRSPDQIYRLDGPQVRVLDFLGDGWLLWTRATPTKPFRLTSIPRPFLPKSPHENCAFSGPL